MTACEGVKPAGEPAGFGHHPVPAIDFCIEVEAILGEMENRRLGFGNGTPAQSELQARVERAMAFRVGADEHAVLAKQVLRRRADPRSVPGADGVAAALAAIRLKFSSGNDVPFERAWITAKEWAAVERALSSEERAATRPSEPDEEVAADFAELRQGLGQIAARVADDAVMVRCCQLIDRVLAGEPQRPVAWYVPSILSFNGVERTSCPKELQPEFEGTVAWHASMLGDAPAVVDKFGVTHHPMPLGFIAPLAVAGEPGVPAQRPESHDAFMALAHKALAEVKRFREMLAHAVGNASYFAADPAEGEFNTHASLDEAIKDAESMLEHAGDDAADWGWKDEPPQICYGVVLGDCVEADRQPAPEGSEFTEIVSYRLQSAAQEVV